MDDRRCPISLAVTASGKAFEPPGNVGLAPTRATEDDLACLCGTCWIRIVEAAFQTDRCALACELPLRTVGKGQHQRIAVPRLTVAAWMQMKANGKWHVARKAQRAAGSSQSIIAVDHVG